MVKSQKLSITQFDLFFSYMNNEYFKDATTVATHSSTIATICRDASDISTNVNNKKHFVHCARDITQATSSLISAVKQVSFFVCLEKKIPVIIKSKIEACEYFLKFYNKKHHFLKKSLPWSFFICRG